MALIFDKYKDNGKYSQFGDAGVLDECIKRLSLNDDYPTCVEFGGADGYFCSNTRHLIESGWNGRMYDLRPFGDVIEKRITPENVNEVVDFCNLLSIDCDGPDYYIWASYTYKPQIVIIEVDSSIPPPKEVIPAGYHATSYTSMVKLGISKGYFLVAHTGNCIFVLNEYRHLFPECKLDPLEYWEQYFDKSHL